MNNPTGFYAGTWLSTINWITDAGGSGHVEWSGVFQALRDLRYDGWLTIESFGFNIGDISAAAAIWRDIEKTPESIAFEGVKFLKENVRRD